MVDGEQSTNVAVKHIPQWQLRASELGDEVREGKKATLL